MFKHKEKSHDPTDTNYVGNSSISQEYIISDHNYGKNNVKILEVVRNGPIHSIKELTVCTKLSLDTQKDYTHGNFLSLFIQKLFSLIKILIQQVITLT